ncbi:MAG TPA: hypothetical protein VF020_13845 [Chthoniobacterales bacterium]
MRRERVGDTANGRYGEWVPTAFEDEDDDEYEDDGGVRLRQGFRQNGQG